MRGHATWQYDENLGYDTAVQIEGVDLEQFDPYQIYGGERYTRMMTRLRDERRAWLRKFPPEDIERAFDLLDAVGLPGFATRRADALSGGIRRWVRGPSGEGGECSPEGSGAI